MAEDFTQMYDAIADSTADKKKRGPRRTYTGQEAREIEETTKTSGRKGCKLPRINFALSPSNRDYVETMARVSGMNLTQFINTIISEHKAEHIDTYNKALEFRNSL